MMIIPFGQFSNQNFVMVLIYELDRKCVAFLPNDLSLSWAIMIVNILSRESR